MTGSPSRSIGRPGSTPCLALLRRGVYGLDEHRDAIERLPPARYLAASAYERWLEAIETLLVEKGLISATDLDAAQEHAHGPAHG